MEITEIFHSIQGEGSRIGIPTTFIRTTRCNLRCEWCDTKYAWEDGEQIEVTEILDKVNNIGCEHICLTGGEPLIQEESLVLIDSLLETDRFEVLVETNGSIDIEPIINREVIVSMDYKTPSSKMNEEMIDDNLDKLRKQDQLKFVISDQEDYNFAKEICKKAPGHTEMIFQPAGGGLERLRWIAESIIQERLDVRVLPQLHKIIWPGEKSR